MMIYPYMRCAMALDRDWTKFVKGILRSELARRGMTYKELAEKLKEIGVDDNEKNLANKVARGTFTAMFFCQCLVAIGCETIRLDQ